MGYDASLPAVKAVDVAYCVVKVAASLKLITSWPACMPCSTKKEPLGHTFNRGYNIPAGLGTEVPFGKPLHVRVSMLLLLLGFMTISPLSVACKRTAQSQLEVLQQVQLPMVLCASV